MAHRLMNRQTGKVITAATAKQYVGDSQDAAMFTVIDSEEKRRDWWHKLGVPVDKALTAEQAIIAAGLDYPVTTDFVYDADMNKIVFEYETDKDGNETDVPKSYPRRIYRPDTGRNFGIVGARYQEVENKTAFDICDELVAKGEACFETAGALEDGKIIWIMLTLPESVTIAGDEIKPYFLLMTRHDGNGCVVLKLTFRRVVCQNTLNWALQKNGTVITKGQLREYKVRHTRNFKEKLAEGKKVLGIVHTYKESFPQVANALLEQKFSDSMFKKLAEHLYKKPEKDASDRAKTNWENSVNQLKAAWNAPDLANVKGTAWGAYNAVADHEDHDKLSRGSESRRAANAFLRTLEADLKDKALDFILAHR